MNKNVKCVSGDLFWHMSYNHEVCIFLEYHYSIQSHKPHPSQREEGSDNAATIEMLTQQKIALTNEINALHGLHLLSTVTELHLRHNVFSGCQHLMALFDDYILR